jgi:putative ABC transport system permease protein
VTALTTKLWRDLWRLKAQALAIALVMASGVAMFVMSFCVIATLQRARADYYERYHFADLFASVKRAPLALLEPLAAIPGVAAADARVVEEVLLDLDDLPEPAVGRLVALPAPPASGLNGLHLRRGRFGEPGRADEVVANEPFAAAHRLGPGDRLRAVLNGRRRVLTIVGVAISPEFVYQIRGGDLFPDDRRFGVLWMDRLALATAFDLHGAWNDLALKLAPDASLDDVVRQVDALTGRYGGGGACGRERQLSHRYVADELSQLRAMAMIAPTLFLAVSAFLLHVVLHRLVATQREQIATLKAFGYSRAEIAHHYLGFTLLIVAAGSLLGIAAGAWLGRGLAGLYGRFFRFPTLDFRVDTATALLGCGIAAATSLLGALGAVARATALAPAEAMRPQAPARHRATLAERLGLGALLSSRVRMIVRQLERAPLRSLLTCTGLALGVAIFVLGSFSKDIARYLVDFQFRGAMRFDWSVALVEPSSHAALHELARLPGVVRCEPFRAVPVRMRAGHHARQLAIQGLEEERELLRTVDLKRGPRELPADGLLLSSTLCDLLEVAPGDRVEVDVLEGDRRTLVLGVADRLDDLSGLSASMEIGALRRALGEGDTISGAYLAVDRERADDLYLALKGLPRVASVTSRRAALATLEEILGENILRMRLYTVAFAAIVVFGVVYNSARITLAERGRELATLRVLGFTVGEISFLLLGEIGLLLLLALPLGAAIGCGFSAVETLAMQTETQRFPRIVSGETYLEAIAVVVVAALLSGLVVRRRLAGLDLVAVLKARD